MDAEVPGNFLALSDGSVRCIDVDMAYLRDSPVSENNISEWMDTLDSYPIPIVETLMYLEEELGAKFIGNTSLLEHPLFPELIIKLCSMQERFQEEEHPISENTLHILLKVMEFSHSGSVNDEDITPQLIVRLEGYDKRRISIGSDLVNQIIKGEHKHHYPQFYKPADDCHKGKHARIEEAVSPINTAGQDH